MEGRMSAAEKKLRRIQRIGNALLVGFLVGVIAYAVSTAALHKLQ